MSRDRSMPRQLSWMPRAEAARGKVRGALPRTPARGTPPETPAAFPSSAILHNGPRRQGFAAPRFRAPLTAPGRSADPTEKRKRRRFGNSLLAAFHRLPLVGTEQSQILQERRPSRRSLRSRRPGSFFN